MQSDGAVCNPPTTQRRTVETTKARAKRAKQQLFFGSPLICRMVQGYRVSYCKNLNKSEGRETILTEEHDCGMPVLLQPPSPLLNVKHSQGEGRWPDRNCRAVGEARPSYWPPPWDVPVVLRSPRGSAAPSSAPLNRACRCWAESGCLRAWPLTEDIKGDENRSSDLDTAGIMSLNHMKTWRNESRFRQTWWYRLVTSFPEKKVLDKHRFPFTLMFNTYKTGLK